MATHSSLLAWRIPWTKESLAGYSPWGRKESDTTERLTLSLYLLIFWLGWDFVAARGLPLVGASGGSSLVMCGFSLRWLLIAEHRL